jgi:hypothetical protein
MGGGGDMKAVQRAASADVVGEDFAGRSELSDQRLF